MSMTGAPPSPVAPSGSQTGPGSAIAADVLARLAEVIESRRGADPGKSYVAKLFHKGADAILKKVGEEATEVVLAAKAQSLAPSDEGRQALVGELADLWFHTLVAMVHLGLRPADVLQELARREGLSGLEEFARRTPPPSPDDARG